MMFSVITPKCSCSGVQKHVNSLVYLVYQTKYGMYISLNCCILTVMLVILSAVELLVCSGVGG